MENVCLRVNIFVCNICKATDTITMTRLLLMALLFAPTLLWSQIPLTPCTPPVGRATLDINNGRTTILNGADKWWDLNTGKYEVPKGSTKNAILAGALWLGAVDDGGQLKVAAQTYRQGGNDFWPGPLDYTDGTTFDTRCDTYDDIYEIKRHEIEAYVRALNDSTSPNPQIPESIMNWPGNRPDAGGGIEQLAPFYDADGDGW